jgi:hypothetical protein
VQAKARRPLDARYSGFEARKKLLAGGNVFWGFEDKPIKTGQRAAPYLFGQEQKRVEGLRMAASKPVAIYFGINPRSFNVDTVWVNSDGSMNWSGAGELSVSHFNQHRIPYAAEIALKFGLQDLVQILPHQLQDQNTEDLRRGLREKAILLRRERDTKTNEGAD